MIRRAERGPPMDPHPPPMRPNRCQPSACRAAIAEALSPALADSVLTASGVADLPSALPGGPRDLAALTAELRPFVALHRELLLRCDHATALAITRRAIIDSGIVSHGAAQESHQDAAPAPGDPLVLTSPPPAGFSAPLAALQPGFETSMRSFSCQGELLSYTDELVRFTITSCNWCRAMEDLGAPELIAFFCETDERFMDHHPTHTLIRPTAIGLGHARCDFQFVRRGRDKVTD
jgi:L-2-amino-thiazoline-4-carboxylic acid hydrolase